MPDSPFFDPTPFGQLVLSEAILRWEREACRRQIHASPIREEVAPMLEIRFPRPPLPVERMDGQRRMEEARFLLDVVNRLRSIPAAVRAIEDRRMRPYGIRDASACFSSDCSTCERSVRDFRRELESLFEGIFNELPVEEENMSRPMRKSVDGKLFYREHLRNGVGSIDTVNGPLSDWIPVKVPKVRGVKSSGVSVTIGDTVCWNGLRSEVVGFPKALDHFRVNKIVIRIAEMGAGSEWERVIRPDDCTFGFSATLLWKIRSGNLSEVDFISAWNARVERRQRDAEFWIERARKLFARLANRGINQLGGLAISEMSGIAFRSELGRYVLREDDIDAPEMYVCSSEVPAQGYCNCCGRRYSVPLRELTVRNYPGSSSLFQHGPTCSACVGGFHEIDGELYRYESGDDYDSANSEDGGNRAVRAYSTQVERILPPIGSPGGPFVGIEIEGGTTSEGKLRKLSKKLLTDGLAILKSDSSIEVDCPAEVVTPPIAISGFHYRDAIKAITEEFKESGFKADASCGVHVHVSRSYASRRSVGMVALLIADPANSVFCDLVFGRPANEFCFRNARINTRVAHLRNARGQLTSRTIVRPSGNFSERGVLGIFDAVADYNNGSGYRQRHLAVNPDTPHDTHEFRMFGPCTTPIKLTAFVEVVLSLLQWGMNGSNGATNWQSYADYIGASSAARGYVKRIEREGRRIPDFATIQREVLERRLEKRTPFPYAVARCAAAIVHRDLGREEYNGDSVGTNQSKGSAYSVSAGE